MMEIVEKSNFRFKALVIALVTVILASTCTMSFGAVIFNRDEKELTLNRKVEFTGDTHYYSDGSAKKLSIFKKGETVRKTYTEENPGCGIITIIRQGAKYPYYVTGEGWISGDQVKSAQRFIQLEINKVENGVNTKLHINGEYTRIETDNTSVVKFENGVLTAGHDGTATVKLVKEDGEEIELMAIVASGNMTLNIPEKEVSADVKADISLMDDKVEIKAEGKAEAALVIEEDGLKIAAEGEGKAELYVDDKKVAECDTEGNMQLEADLNGIKVEAEAEQRVSILDKLTARIREKGKIEADKEHIAAEAEGKAEVNDKEVLEGKTSVNYNYGDEDPTGSANLEVLEKEVVNVEDQTIPVVSGLKALIARIRK